MQKLLKYTLIGRVQEYYFVNMTIVTAAFLVFHFEGLKTFTIYNDSPVKATLSVILGSIMVLLFSWILVKVKSHSFMAGSNEVVAFIPLLVLSTVSLLAVSSVLETQSSPLELIISWVLFFWYGTKLSILLLYTFLERLYYTENRLYRSIKQRLEESLGNYQMTGQEVWVLVIAALLAVFLLTKTDMNPFTQYLIAYSVADGVAHTLEKLRGTGVIKN